MGHTNSTANLALPQFIGTDKPTWLSDVNGAFAAIDTYAGNNDAALAITDAKADTAISDAAGAVTTATNASNTAGNAAATATAANTVAGNALTVANGINSKVGVLTDLTTTDKSTVVNAINEVNGKDAGDIAYDNTGSGLTATNVQAAIDEVAQGGGGGGSSTPIATITGDGATSFSSALDGVFADMSTITNKAYAELTISGAKYIMPVVAYQSGTVYEFSMTTHRTGGYTGKTFRVLASSSQYLSGTGSSITDDSSLAIPAGDTIKIYA